jgi:hypothetical protein
VLKPVCAVPGTWTKSELDGSLARLYVSVGGLPPIKGKEEEEKKPNIV